MERLKCMNVLKWNIEYFDTVKMTFSTYTYVRRERVDEDSLKSFGEMTL